MEDGVGRDREVSKFRTTTLRMLHWVNMSESFYLIGLYYFSSFSLSSELY